MPGSGSAVPHPGRSAGPAFRCSLPEPQVPVQARPRPDAAARRRAGRECRDPGLGRRMAREARKPARRQPRQLRQLLPRLRRPGESDGRSRGRGEARRKTARARQRGVEALGLWLADAVRTGLDGAPQQPPATGARPRRASTMRRLRACAARALARGAGGGRRRLGAAARCHRPPAPRRRRLVALRRCRRPVRPTCARSPASRGLRGCSRRRPSRGPWRVLGSRSEIEDGLCTRRCWLRRPADGGWRCCSTSRRPASRCRRLRRQVRCASMRSPSTPAAWRAGRCA